MSERVDLTDSDTVSKCPESVCVVPRLPVFQQQNENTALSRKQAELNAAPRDSIVHFIAFCKDEWKQQHGSPSVADLYLHLCSSSQLQMDDCTELHASSSSLKLPGCICSKDHRNLWWEEVSACSKQLNTSSLWVTEVSCPAYINTSGVLYAKSTPVTFIVTVTGSPFRHDILRKYHICNVKVIYVYIKTLWNNLVFVLTKKYFNFSDKIYVFDTLFLALLSCNNGVNHKAL